MISRYERRFRDVTDLPAEWSADDVEICQTNYPHPTITSGQHTNGPAMIWIRRGGGDWVRTGETHMHKVRKLWEIHGGEWVISILSRGNA